MSDRQTPPDNELPWPAFRIGPVGVTHFNRSWCALLGVDAMRDVVDWCDDVVVADREEARRRWHAALEAPCPWEMTTRLQAVDGHEVPVIVRLLPTSGGWYGAVADLSQERAAVDEVQERLRTAEEAAGIGTWESDLLLDRSRFSPALSKMLGMQGEQVFFGNTEHLFHPADLEVLERNMAKALDPVGPGSAVFEVRMLRVDGSVLWIRSSGRTIFDPQRRQALRMVGTSVDITEIRQAERRLATQNAVSSVLAEATSLSEATPKIIRAVCETEGWDFGGIWEIDSQHGVLRCAEMWHDPALPLESVAAQTRLVSHARGEGLPGRVWAERQPIAVDAMTIAHHDPCAVVAIAAGLRSALAFPIMVAGEVIAVVEFVGRVHVPADEGLFAMFGAIGRQLGMFFERQRSDAERRVLESQLHQAQRMEAIGQLSGGIAHDFNNILAAIIGNVQLAMMDLTPEHPAVESLEQIGQASARARTLVQQILTFARQRPQQRQVMAPGPIVDESVRLLRAIVPAGVDFAVDIDPDVADIDADATQLEQVIVNLGTNAWHALDGAAGTISVGLRRVEVDATSARQLNGLSPGTWVVLTVADTGRGMEQEVLERVFEPFFTTKHAGKGTGLGLSVVHGIVKGHGGAVAVTSRPGEGTRFQIYFPAAASTARVEQPAAPVVTAGGNGQHVLFVDDEAPLVALHKRLLQQLGYRVTAFTSPAAALAAFLAEPWSFSAVLTDMNMPGVSGLQLATEMLRARPDMPVLLASGYITDELQAELSRLGIREVLHKPVAVAQLGEALARALRAVELPAVDSVATTM